MNAIARERLTLAGAIGGAAIAVVDGATALGCAPNLDIVFTVAGSFGAAAAMAALITQRRAKP